MTNDRVTEADRRAAAEERGKAGDERVQQWIKDGKPHQHMGELGVGDTTKRGAWWFVGIDLVIAANRYADKRLSKT